MIQKLKILRKNVKNKPKRMIIKNQINSRQIKMIKSLNKAKMIGNKIGINVRILAKTISVR